MDERSKPYRIVIGQKVTEGKVQTARSTRRNMTAAERTLWQRLRGNKIGSFHFRRQQIIAGFIVDFYCHKAALAVELDGATHDREHDRERDRVLAGKGITILRFWNHQVLKETDKVILRISQWLEERQEK